ELKPLAIISEQKYQDMSLRYGHIFEASMGAEAIRNLMKNIDLPALSEQIKKQLVDSRALAKEKLIKRLKLVNALHRNGLDPDWMVLTKVPVIPPDLRPMVPLDGGRFATSDLNDLYRRIINRNNRLKQLLELNAPEVIVRNEKRMLQEAVDALIDNSARHGKTVVAATGQKRQLKSLADILKGKQGRFRQNLLGKRIDYSGRSVIVVGPSLRINQCGIPKRMAIELFKPFIISRLIKDEYVHNVRSASRFIESGRPEVWDILEEVTAKAHVLLNRAPTLHRLGIQAFKPVLIEGKAIQVHPLVTTAFNADFDGDQMAVHVPLTEQAKCEAAEIMLSSKNLLKPATGEPIASPSMDMVWGVYYVTMMDPKANKANKANKSGQDSKNLPKVFATVARVGQAFQHKQLKLHQPVLVPIDGLDKEVLDDEGVETINNGSRKYIRTTPGRINFNSVLPIELPFYNRTLGKDGLKQIVRNCLDLFGRDNIADTLDTIKSFGFKHLTLSGYSWGMDDVPYIDGRKALIIEGDKLVEEIENQYATGLLTESERHAKIIEVWMGIKEKIADLGRDILDPEGSVYTMVESGARGSWSQLIQIVGMKGLVTNPSGDIIELPVKGNLKEGFDVLEYFISTHGARKGLADTALRTANAGYLTRRLVDVAQDLVIRDEDCGTENSLILTQEESDNFGVSLADRSNGRYLAAGVTDPKTKKVVIKKGTLIGNEEVAKINEVQPVQVEVRSVLECESLKGLCQKCYGVDLSYNKLVNIGTAVGIMAAQSIGEPGTQLTMRTFHTGGVAGKDITQGLPRVEEIFETRTPKRTAFLAGVDGKVRMPKPEAVDGESAPPTNQKIVEIEYTEVGEDSYPFKTAADKATDKNRKAVVADGANVKKDDVIITNDKGKEIKAKRAGKVAVNKEGVVITVRAKESKVYEIPADYHLSVAEGDLVTKGLPMTDGHYDLKEFYALRGRVETQRYIISEIQNIYASQGQKLNDKHIELIARQLFSRVLILDPGDTDLLVGERIETGIFRGANKDLSPKKKPAEAEELLMGITKVSLSTSSFLSASSFQETARVLINAAVEGRVDKLEGLKENVIIGRLIPAGTGLDDGAIKQCLINSDKEITARKIAEAEAKAAAEAAAAAEVDELSLTNVEARAKSDEAGSTGTEPGQATTADSSDGTSQEAEAIDEIDLAQPVSEETEEEKETEEVKEDKEEEGDAKTEDKKE
ncbi:DNA-directed RNA polymerase subunit beta', partial [bacterium]|nr:DNA-directed RNA polymerase subunit beta' [bacterium]